MRRYWNLLLVLFLALLIGCATLLPQRIPVLLERPKQCQEFLTRLDEKVREATVRDASTFPVPGFPYLRTNRFLTTLKNDLKNDQEREQWLRWMQQLDLRSRKKEIHNLPDQVVLSLLSEEGGQPDREKLFAHIESCSRELLNHDLTRSDFCDTLYPLVKVPDEYSLVRRAIGLYPLLSIPVIIATKDVRDEFQEWYDMKLDELPVEGKLTAFVPPQGVRLREQEIQILITHSKRNPLAVPWPHGDEAKRIVLSFAPIILQDVAAPYDQFGRVVWDGDRLRIDGERPTVYYYMSHALLKGKPILQINYVIWYSKRAGERTPSIERGDADGMTARISLDAHGNPFMVDIMNNCGCYHLFSPIKERLDRLVSKDFRLDAFVPQWLPESTPGKRLGIRVNSGWHQVERLLAAQVPSDSIRYDLVPYDVLEALPREGGPSESMFDEKGIAKGSERSKEEILFFPMGIPSVGSMRQRGHHPIALTGRVHFDEPRLFERYFVFK